MSKTGRQISAIVGMNVRSLPQRWALSLATVVAVALVTGVLLAFLAMANGFRQTVQGAGAPDVALVLRESSNAELNSTLSREAIQLIEEGPGLARGPDGRPLVSAELYVIVDGTKRSSGTSANLPLRGVGPNALLVRPGVQIVEGRMFTPGSAEVVVGAGVPKEFVGFEVGQTVRLAGANYAIVGRFAANGSVFESELWGDTAVLQGAYQRGSTVQSARARLTDPGQLAALKAYADADPRLNVEVQSEQEYYARQASGLATLITFLGWPLAILMSFGALAGALNTMYAAVDARRREIATLRALGFSGFPAFVGALSEALVLAAIGGLLGAGGAYVLFQGLTASTLGGSFSQVVFAFQLSPFAVLQGVGLALVIGLIGGVPPAIRAARTPLLAAFRDG